ncbi:MAG TPA: amidohydrolase family protein [Thermoanaerobaculia bacterium]|nr:amidohydrolase family protein [Thermoanaerobaculia bacterium]
MRKIALEEAFTAPSTEPYLEITLKAVDDKDKPGFIRLLEDSEARIAAMDDAGIDIFVLSQTSPGVQAEKDAAVAVRRAREANDYLHGQIALHPDRYRGFAHLPMQDVQAASDELERCVKDLGFVGALINGSTNGIYLDDACYLPFWERAVELGVPVYIHPADPLVQPYVLEGYPIMQGALWGWSMDNSCHFLRLLFSGLFDRLPGLTIILGHMGETLPYFLWRIDSRYKATTTSDKPPLKKEPSDYFRSNLIITTTGVCQDSALQCALAEMGEDRVLFSVDYPYEVTQEAAEWIEHTPLTDTQREKICYRNAERVLRLDVPARA